MTSANYPDTFKSLTGNLPASLFGRSRRLSSGKTLPKLNCGPSNHWIICKMVVANRSSPIHPGWPATQTLALRMRENPLSILKLGRQIWRSMPSFEKKAIPSAVKPSKAASKYGCTSSDETPRTRREKAKCPRLASRSWRIA